MKSLEEAIKQAVNNRSPDQVTRLELDSLCRLNGDWKPFSLYQGLTVLSLSNTYVSNLAGFPTLPLLKILILSENRISGGLEHLAQGSLVNLKMLDLAFNVGIKRLDQLEPLKKLPELKKLCLDGCPVKDVPGFHEKVFELLPGLEYLDQMDKQGKECDVDYDDDDDEIADDEGEAEESYDDEDEEDEAADEVEGSEEVVIDGGVVDDDDEAEADEERPEVASDDDQQVKIGIHPGDEKDDDEGDDVLEGHDTKKRKLNI
ncbi:hypothetical protein CEUSTIGMA_g9001.t1 [Chlamydomonas eustigma]|uniref:U2A'/phosphoprotein 32 family A C-terminal domain-containing protein n=1 Tax=Chlamydomonas eustigma TaxID=1157962 RepID=A0A250XET9_9CHLO|nr:hypothetical protein CEUSTIGMA_g9001.t1 [Chlamydomonas eustigma]|eukprot:GAX81573.1 hypothetical protein CEUSTIGMA_g9001.t1 [Chlamydomonas eustigma]